MRGASLAIASLLVLGACGGGNSQTAGRTMAERFPVPDDLVGTSFVLECPAAKAEVRKADGAIDWFEEVIVDPEVSDTLHDLVKKKLPGAYGDRAAYIAANPKCFNATRLAEAHKFIDAAKSQYEDWLKGDPV